MSIKLGIIGAGAIGNVHANAAKNAGSTVVGFADVNEAAAKAAAQQHGAKIATGKIDELIGSDEIDAVVIGVPNKFHKPLAIAAAEAGKDILLEKPMALTVKECQEINAAVKKHKRILQMGMVQRYSSVAVTSQQFMKKKRLGNIYHAKANIYRRRGIPGLGGWFTTKALSGGGPLIDIGVHIIDLAMYLMDFPKPVRVSGKVYDNFGKDMKKYLYEGMWAGPPNYKGTFDVEDAAHALIRFEGGLTMEVNATWAMNFPDGSVQDLVGFFGDKGGLTFTLGGSSVKIATEQDGHNVDLSPKLRSANGFEDEHRDFANNVKKRKEPHASGERGEIVLSILQGIYESSEKDREVEI